MRKLFLLLLALPFFFAGCSDDDDAADNILGTWAFSKSEATKIITDNGEADGAIKRFIEEDNEDETLIFENGGKLKIIDADNEEFIESYSVKGNKLTVHGFGASLTMDIAISANTLTMVYDATQQIKEELAGLLGAELAAKVTVSEVIIKATYTKK